MKYFKKYLLIVVFLLTLLITISCNEKSIFNINIETELVTSCSYSYDIKITNDVKVSFKLTLSEEGIVSINESEKKITALKEGSVDLTVSASDDVKKTITLKVRDPKKYTIKYNLNGGVCDNLVNEYDELHKDIILPAAAKEGYVFSGWFEKEDFSGEKVTIIKEKEIGNKEYFAKFEKRVYTYKVSFNTNGGTQVKEIEFNYLTETFTLPETTKEGYVFSGWFEKEDFNGEKVVSVEKGTEKNITLYAKFEKEVITYKVSFNTNGGTQVKEIEFNYLTETFTLPETTKEGYVFSGWFEKEDFNGEKVVSVEKGTEKNITLYAKYDIVKYIITLNTNGVY